MYFFGKSHTLNDHFLHTSQHGIKLSSLIKFFSRDHIKIINKERKKGKKKKKSICNYQYKLRSLKKIIFFSDLFVFVHYTHTLTHTLTHSFVNESAYQRLV